MLLFQLQDIKEDNMRKIIVMLLLIPCFTFGQSVTIRPSGDGYYIGLTPSTGSAWQCIDESVANDLTDYVYGIYGDECHFTHTSAGLTGTETITSVTLGFKAITTGGTAYINPSYYINSTTYYSIDAATVSTSWVIYEETLTTSPDTGIAWTKAEIDAMQIGFYASYFGDPDEVRITQLYAIINYTGGGGSSSFKTKLLLQGTGK